MPRKCINFELNISDKTGDIHFLVEALKKSRAQQYNENKTIFSTRVSFNHYWASKW